MSSKPDPIPQSQVFDMEDTAPVGSTETDYPRWAELGLADPVREGSLPEQGSTADVLAFAVTQPGAVDPIEGGMAQVRAEMKSISTLCGAWERRLDALMLLLRRADGRAPTPDEPDDVEEPVERPEPT